MRRLHLSGSWVWLLTIQWPTGQAVRLSSRPCALSTRAGTLLRYRGGLPPVRWRWEAPLFDVAVGQAGLSLDVDLGDRHAHQAATRPLEGARVEVAAVALGAPFDQRMKVLVGRVRRAVLGVAGQRASLDLTEEIYDDQGLLLRPGAIVTVADWPDAAADAVGRALPLVMGAPGLYRGTDGEGTTAGSPGLVLKTTTWLAEVPCGIACHEVSAETVTVLNVTTGERSTRPVANNRTGTGSARQAYASVDLHPLTDFDGDSAATVDDDWWIIWDQGGGGWLDETRTRAARGADELLPLALTRSMLKVDAGRCGSARVDLAPYQLDTYVDDPNMRPWDWIRQVLLPVCPVSVVSGPAGLYPVPWRVRGGTDQVVAHLVVGKNCARASRDEPADIDPIASVRVGFAPDGATGTAQRTLVVGPDDADGNDQSTSLWAVRAGHRTQAEEAVTLDAVHDADTGWLVAHDRLMWAGMRGRLIELDATPDLAGLDLGDVVAVTDSARSWAGRVALVQAVELAGAYPRLALFVVCP